MSIRLYNTIHTNPDPMISLVNIGLLSSLELWLGIVVACMPTMGPLFLTYIKPAFSKVYGRSTDKHIDLRDMGGVNTIGGSGPSNEGRHFRKAYQEIGSSFTSQDIESGDLPLVAPGKATLQTNCEHYERAVPRSRDDGIYVQKQFHTQEF
jgi:hypothetical protein